MNLLKKIFGKKEVPAISYADFWDWFQKNEKTFFEVVKQQGNIEKGFFDKLSPKLDAVKEGFYFVTGMCDANTVELVLTAEGALKNIFFVEELVKAAPKITGWKFTALKPALNIDDVSIEMAGYKFNTEKLSFYSNERADYPDEIDVTIVHNDLTEDNKDQVTNGTYIFLDNYIGELNFATTIDNLTVIGRPAAEKELVPIGKLKDFLIWRQKEFVEKYEGIRHNTDNDSYSLLEAKLKNGTGLIAVINADLLKWDSKASHPWILNVEIKFNGKNNNGMPDQNTSALLEEIEEAILKELKDSSGYLNIGRQTAENEREIYFACKDFRLPSKVMHQVKNIYSKKLEIDYSIYKDKYWQSFDRFIDH